MKKNFFFLLFVGSFFSLTPDLYAQDEPLQPEPYWVIESNIKTPKKSIVYFYSAGHELMYKENVECRKLKVGNKKTVKRLNAALHEVSLAWQNEKRVKDNEQIIAKRF